MGQNPRLSLPAFDTRRCGNFKLKRGWHSKRQALPHISPAGNNRKLHLKTQILDHWDSVILRPLHVNTSPVSRFFFLLFFEHIARSILRRQRFCRRGAQEDIHLHVYSLHWPKTRKIILRVMVIRGRRQESSCSTLHQKQKAKTARHKQKRSRTYINRLYQYSLLIVVLVCKSTAPTVQYRTTATLSSVRPTTKTATVVA